MVNVVDLGADVNKVVHRFNNNNDKSLKNHDFWNYQAKLKKELGNEIDKLEFLNYKATKFSLDNLLLDTKGNHVIKDRTFYILHSLERHWVNVFYYLVNIDEILTFVIKVL